MQIRQQQNIFGKKTRENTPNQIKKQARQSVKKDDCKQKTQTRNENKKSEHLTKKNWNI